MGYLDFLGTSYLGLDRNMDFMELIHKGIEKYGVNFGGSRLNNSVPVIYDEFEKFISRKLHCEDSVLTSSGTLAGVLFSHYLNKHNFILIVSKDLHPAIKSNLKSFFEFSNIESLIKLVATYYDKGKPMVVLANSINSITLKKLDIEKIKNVISNKNILLVVDDSHSIGVLGEDGWGMASGLNKSGLKFILISSLAKAFALEGGIISGDKNIVNEIKQYSLWGGASPPTPFYPYAMLNGMRIIEKQRVKLKENINYFKTKIPSEIRLNFINDFPVFLVKDISITKKMLKKNIRISSFRYPTKNDPHVERIILNSNHSFKDIDKLISNL